MEWIKSEKDGFFFLCRADGYYEPFDLSSGDIGLGRPSQVIMRFKSEEAREYFIQSDTYRRAMLIAQSDAQRGRNIVGNLFTKSGRIRPKRRAELLEWAKR